ncbi:MAG: DUF4097 family beta strand repeat-containing protein [Hominilimicola sp.]
MKAKKIIFIIAGLFVLFGVIISGIAVALLGASPYDKGQMQTHTVTENISKINIFAEADDIRIVEADTDNIKVTYTEDKIRKYDFGTENGTLSLESVPRDTLGLKWYDYVDFNINFKDRVKGITLEIPKGFNAEITLNSRYGDIYAADLKGSINIKADCGDVKIAKSEFSKIECNLDYGDIEMEKVSADSINLTNDCGDIEIEEVSGNISASCAYGDIGIEKISGSNITLENNCGDIEGTILGNEADYTINAETNLGDSNIQNRTGGKNTLNVRTDLGDLFIKFI